MTGDPRFVPLTPFDRAEAITPKEAAEMFGGSPSTWRRRAEEWEIGRRVVHRWMVSAYMAAMRMSGDKAADKAWRHGDRASDIVSRHITHATQLRRKAAKPASGE